MENSRLVGYFSNKLCRNSRVNKSICPSLTVLAAAPCVSILSTKNSAACVISFSSDIVGLLTFYLRWFLENWLIGILMSSPIGASEAWVILAPGCGIVLEL